MKNYHLFFALFLVFIFFIFGIIYLSNISSSAAGTQCNPERLNQIYDVNVYDRGWPLHVSVAPGNNVTTYTQYYPINDYQKVKIINTSILAYCSPVNISTSCYYSINGVQCGTFGSGNITGIGGEQIYSVSCLSSIKPGINFIVINSQHNLTNPNYFLRENGSISKVFVEMELVPANC